MKRILTGIIVLSAFSAAHAAPSSWEINPAESSITFTATQNNSPVSGKFKDFKADISADTNQLSSSHIHIVVNTNSVSTSYAMIGDALKTSDWLDTKKFPEAVFDADAFTQTGKNTYQAKGTLTLRGKTLPIVLNFEADTSTTKDKAVVKGSTLLKRTAFGVGQGDWSKTTEIKDDVTINFVITASKK
jgi:polyisoprenoid-binding protein YceI